MIEFVRDISYIINQVRFVYKYVLLLNITGYCKGIKLVDGASWQDIIAAIAASYFSHRA